MNKYTSQPPTEVIRARLKVILDNVSFLYKSGNSVLESNLVSAYAQAMDTFVNSLGGSIVGTAAKIKPGMPADPTHFNIIIGNMGRDLEAMFAEMSALDKLITASFNSIVAEYEQVLQVSKRIRNKLGNYILYADTSQGAGFFFGDSFNGADYIEIGSSLVDTAECFLGQEEGIVLLPLAGDPDRPKIKKYILNSSSNGVAGNNSEIGVLSNSAIEAMGDNEPNTWYEYEKVTSFESTTPLVFDLTIVLEEISIVNHININPINFGTPTPVKIKSLETSKDGVEYTSVKDEIPIKDFVPEDEENIFELSPATSKYAGQGFYSFLPRRVQYVHITLEQHTPYSINTVNGTRLRYAIGIRDINILGRKFAPEGSLVSTRFNVNGEARKISLVASENPTEESVLADVKHFISENDGAVWRPIQPQGRSGHLIPEIVDFNTIAESSVSTDTPVTSLRHKISMKRDPEQFTGNVTIKEERISVVDVVTMSTTGDFTISVSEKPIAESVRVVLPYFGSYSCPTARYGSSIVGASTPMDLDFITFIVDVPAIDTLRFRLPLANFSNLVEHIRVFVNGEQIEYCSKDVDALGTNSFTSYSPVDENSKVYFLGKGGRELQFGYVDPSTGDKYGFLPPAGAKIQVCLDGDNPRVELTEVGYVLNLTAPSDGIKNNVSLVSLDDLTANEASDYIITLYPGRTKFSVHEDIEDKAVSMLKTWKPNEVQKLGKREVVKTLEKDEVSTKIETTYVSDVQESQEGIIPPIFSTDSSDWGIEEYDSNGNLLASGSTWLNTKRAFIDGRQELLDWNGLLWQQNYRAYSFDPYSGIVYTGSSPLTYVKTVFRCKKLKVTNITPENWEYYKSPINKRINTQKIVVNPKYVVTHKRSVALDGRTTAKNQINLIENNTVEHSWYNQRLVKGTVTIDASLFPYGAKPTEVLFVNGDLELSSVVQIADEAVTLTSAGSNLYTYSLGSIDLTHILDGPPSFKPVRSESVVSTPASIFTSHTTGTPSSNGQWSYSINSTTGVCTITVYLSSSSDASKVHVVSYRYKATDPGVDVSSQYSIDYEAGTIHFAQPITRNGNIKFEISTYSAFYNIAEVVNDGDINKVNEEGKEITFSTEFGIKFLKQDTVEKARPNFGQILYDTYLESTESLEDLEPYFSPLLKDLAFRVVTSDVLEEL